MMYTFILATLVVLDYILGSGVVQLFQMLICKLICFIRKSIKEEEKIAQTRVEDVVSFQVLLFEITFLGLTIVFLNKFKQIRCKDKFDDLLKESRDALRQTNEFLEKWRLRRLNMQLPQEYSYLDEEPQKIMPYKLEVPILHMAIVDTLGARNQPESGDTGDVTSYTDAALLSMTSLLDDDFDSTTDDAIDERFDETKISRNRILWDVMEEDGNFDE